MSTKLQIVRLRDFIKSTPRGELDIEAARAALEDIYRAASTEAFEILIDLRDARSALSNIDVWYLARELGEYGDTFRRKTAILLRPEGSVDQARFFELAARNRGHQAQVFVDFEQAMYWLSSVEEVDEPTGRDV